MGYITKVQGLWMFITDGEEYDIRNIENMDTTRFFIGKKVRGKIHKDTVSATLDDPKEETLDSPAFANILAPGYRRSDGPMRKNCANCDHLADDGVCTYYSNPGTSRWVCDTWIADADKKLIRKSQHSYLMSV